MTARYNLVNVLFDELITYRLLERKRLWKKLLDLEEFYRQETGDSFAALQEAVIDHLSKMPVDSDQSLDENLDQLFTSETLSTEQREEKRRLISRWEEFVTNHLQQAHELIEDSRAGRH